MQNDSLQHVISKCVFFVTICPPTHHPLFTCTNPHYYQAQENYYFTHTRTSVFLKRQKRDRRWSKEEEKVAIEKKLMATGAEVGGEGGTVHVHSTSKYGGTGRMMVMMMMNISLS